MKIKAFKTAEDHVVHDYGADIVIWQGQYQDAVPVRLNAKKLLRKLKRHLRRKKHASR